MASTAPDTAVRDYLRALKDPSSLRDDDSIADLQKQLEEAADGLERLRLRQQLLNAQTPSIQRYEEGFVTHAKAWADEHDITVKAFIDEGVSSHVLRRAGFNVPGARGRAPAGGRGTTGRARRSRVTVDEVRAAIGDQPFTIKDLQRTSGASPAVVRKVVAEEEKAGRLRNVGTEREHRGPGRAPVLYQRA